MINLNINNHDLIKFLKLDREYICLKCGILLSFSTGINSFAGEDFYHFYTRSAEYNRYIYNLDDQFLNNLTCEEFIIKNLIE